MLQTNDQGLGKIFLRLTPPEESISSLAPEVVLAVVKLNWGWVDVLSPGVSLVSFVILI